MTDFDIDWLISLLKEGSPYKRIPLIVKAVEKNRTIGRVVRTLQQIMLSCLNRIGTTRTERIYCFNKIMSKLVLTEMTETNPQSGE